MQLKGEAPNRLSNKEVVAELKEVLAAMEIKGANIFKIRAYQNAIAAIESLTVSVYDVWQSGKIGGIAGIGSTLTAHLGDLFKTGKVAEFEAVKKDLPEGMFPLIGIRGVGAKTAFKLASAFKLSSREGAVEKVREVAEKGLIRVLPGFAEKKEKDILTAITDAKKTKNESERMLLPQAEEISRRILAYLKSMPEVKQVEVLGSLRRRSPTVGDLDFAVATNSPDEVIKKFVEYPEAGEILRGGDKKGGIILKEGGVQAEIRVSTPEAYGAMLQYGTGSKQHNVELRTYALTKGLSLSEYGIKQGSTLHEFAGEEEFYKKIGIDYIPPEIRQGKNEVELASTHALPKLVEISDIKGDLHTHTNFSDGISTLEEMLSAAKEKGYEYYGVSDHAPSIQSRGKYEVSGILFEQLRRIELFNESNNGLRVLLGYEVNILADGKMSLPDDFLKKLHYVVASIHTAFNQPKQEITSRLVAAIRNPYVNIIGHPSGRLLNQRPAYEVDWETVFAELIEHDKVFEINSQPNRLDLPEDLVYEGLKQGMKFVVNSDAHSTIDLNFMNYGIDTARRSWCTKNDILNTLPFEELKKSLRLRV